MKRGSDDDDALTVSAFEAVEVVLPALAQGPPAVLDRADPDPHSFAGGGRGAGVRFASCAPAAVMARAVVAVEFHSRVADDDVLEADALAESELGALLHALTDFAVTEANAFSRLRRRKLKSSRR